MMPLENRRQAVGPKANVDTRAQQSFEREGGVAEVMVTARTMHDMDLPGGQKLRITAPQVICMNRQQVRAERAATLEMPNRRNGAAIRSIAAAPLEPIVHRA